MALIKCPECGKEVSNNAAACPHCGCPLQSSSSVKICNNCGSVYNIDAVRCPKCHGTVYSLGNGTNLNSMTRAGRICPKCGGEMQVQSVSEGKKTGCITTMFYILLACTIIGLLIVIPLMLRKKDEVHTYAICQRCGLRQRLS